MNENNGFYIKLDNCKFLINVLKSLHFKELATIFASKEGLRLTVEDCKCVQGNLFLQESVFQQFKISPKCAIFKINLNILIECLSVFGANVSGSYTSLIMCYQSDEDCLNLLLEEEGVITECKIRTMDAVETLNFNFSTTKHLNRIIMKSEYLKDIFKEIDQSSEIVQFVICPSPAHLRISTYGDGGSTYFDFPKNSNEIESFECLEKRSIRYKLSLLRNMFKVLSISTKVSIRTNEYNFLALQFKIPSDSNMTCFVEFFCVPDEDGDYDYEGDSD